MKKPTAINVVFTLPRVGSFEFKAKMFIEFTDSSATTIEYYHDEIRFSRSEIIGKTLNEIRELYREKDIAYLRS